MKIETNIENYMQEINRQSNREQKEKWVLKERERGWGGCMCMKSIISQQNVRKVECLAHSPGAITVVVNKPENPPAMASWKMVS